MKCCTRIFVFIGLSFLVFVLLFSLPWERRVDDDGELRVQSRMIYVIEDSLRGPSDDSFTLPIENNLSLLTESREDLLKSRDYVLRARDDVPKYRQDLVNLHDNTTRSRGKLLNASCPADDPQLVDIVRTEWVQQPSKEYYQLKNSSLLDHSQCGQSLIIDQLLGSKTKGFFVEAGAFNGESHSNSLFFEKERQWSGLLIEANPYAFEVLLSKHRKAFTVKACLALKGHPEKLSFQLATILSGLEDTMISAHQKRIDKSRLRGKTISVQCFPLYTMLLALNRTVIDYFSLDVEGAEARILKTIPFDKLDIKVIQVEHNHRLKTRRHYKKILEPWGYTFYRTICQDDVYVKDLSLT